MWRRKEEAPEFVEGQEYTARELELMADELLRADSRTELCRECGRAGTETGDFKSVSQGDYIDPDGNPLILDFAELSCDGGHKWYQGEGKAKGIAGENPILFEEHIASRRRREIYTSIGTPDPSIEQGMYNRIHKDGRKVNSPEQRKKNGAAFYAG